MGNLMLRGTFATLMLLTAVSAEETMTTIEGRKALVPYVGYAQECNSLCLFKSETEIGKYNSWCLKGAPPMARVGWAFGQRYAESSVQLVGSKTIPAIKYYQLELLPYVQVNAYVESVLEIQKLIYWQVIGNMRRFKVQPFFSMIINSEFSMCPGFGYEYDAADFALSTSLKLTDCYKKIIKDLCDFSSTWTGYEAKIFDDCNSSNDAPIKLNKWQLFDQLADKIVGGTVNPMSNKYCQPLPGIGTKTVVVASDGDGAISDKGLIDSFARMAYSAIGNYMWDNHRDDEK